MVNFTEVFARFYASRGGVSYLGGEIVGWGVGSVWRGGPDPVQETSKSMPIQSKSYAVQFQSGVVQYTGVVHYIVGVDWGVAVRDWGVAVRDIVGGNWGVA